VAPVTAHGRPGCTFPGDCTHPAVLAATWVVFLPGGPYRGHVTFQPLTGQGQPVCLDHSHHLVDVLILRSTPEPASIAEEGNPT
jgi:hypothetical protein